MPSSTAVPDSAVATTAVAAAMMEGHPLFGDEIDDDEEDSEEELEDDESEEEDFDASVGRAPEDSPSSSTDVDDRSQNLNLDTSNQLQVLATPQNGASAVFPFPLSTVDHSFTGFETPNSKRLKTESGSVASEERKSSAALEDSRRLFQRLWTDEDEIAILQGFYEFTSQRGTTHHAHQHDTGPFYEQIKSRLQLDFTKNQLVEKLRRLKKKYRNVVSRMSSGRDFAFKSSHDQVTYEISKKIWSNTVQPGSYDHDDDDCNEGEHVVEKKPQRHRRRGRKRLVSAVSAALVDQAGFEAVAVEVKAVPSFSTPIAMLPPTPTPTPTPTPAPALPVNSNVVEETVRSCLSPLFKELINCATSGPLVSGMGNGSLLNWSLMPLNYLSNLQSTGAKDAAADEKWRKQQILELEVYSKRLELVQEQIKVTLEGLRSSGR